MKALIVVDAQYDFMPISDKNKKGGALAVTDGDKIIPVVNELLSRFDLVIFTQDWHPEEMDCFATTHDKEPFTEFTNKQGEKDTLWPAHCIAGTNGAKIHEDIDISKCRDKFYFFKKGLEKDYHPYSGFGAEGLKEFLEENNVDKIFIVGLALDYCVKDTAIDFAMNGFDTTVILDGTKPINSNIKPTLEEFIQAEVNVIESWELSMYNLL